MKKIIGLIMIVMVAFFLLGCTTPEDTPANTIDSVDAANTTIDDVSTDISGLDESLSEIDNILGEEGA
jgi:PBP1b-binding outer membrane lipoprotein LpoB